jgi:hypothetical protein
MVKKDFFVCTVKATEKKEQDPDPDPDKYVTDPT